MIKLGSRYLRLFSTQSKRELYYQRMDHENKVKLLANKLSASTTATDLTSLLSFSVRMDRHDLARKAVELFTPQRIGELTDSELGEVMASMILLPGDQQVNQWQSIQFIIMRRVHQMEAKDLGKIIQSYAYLISKNKLPQAGEEENSGSVSLIKTLEFTFEKKSNELRDPDGLQNRIKTITSLLRLSLHKNESAGQVLLAIFDSSAGPIGEIDKLVEEFQNVYDRGPGELDFEHDKLAPALTELLQVVTGIDEKFYNIQIQKEIKIEQLVDTIIEKYDSGTPQMLIQLLTVHQRFGLQELFEKVTLRLYDSLKSQLLVEERKILLDFCAKTKMNGYESIVRSIQNELITNLYQDSNEESISLAAQLRRWSLQWTDEQLKQFTEFLESVDVVRLQHDILPDYVSLVSESPQEGNLGLKMASQETLSIVLEVLGMKNFTVKTYLMLFSGLLTRYEQANLDFWREFVGLYAPILPLEDHEYRILQGLIYELSNKPGVKGEMDFSAIQEFLREKYE